METKKRVDNIDKIKSLNKKIIISSLPKKAQDAYEAETPKFAKWGKWLSWGATAISLINTAASMFVGADLPGIPDQWNNAVMYSIPITGFLGYLFDFFEVKKKDGKEKEK